MSDEIRALLPRHLPSYEVRSIAEPGEGSDNVVYEVNGELIVRRSKETDPASRSEATRREADLLAVVAELSTLPVPEPVFANVSPGPKTRLRFAKALSTCCLASRRCLARSVTKRMPDSANTSSTLLGMSGYAGRVKLSDVRAGFLRMATWRTRAAFGLEGRRSMPEENETVAATGPEEILYYWFPEDINDADLETFRRQGERWMRGGPEVDREITERFGEVLEQARRGELDHWADTPRGRLALIIVLDQFSRNIYRGSPHSYSQDERALKLALEGIERGMDRQLGAVERSFFWLPLGHSEDLDLHERSVRHAEEEAANAPPHQRAMAEFGVSQARAARDVIARFGRHPHRNEILGRTSTPEELEYLRTETPPHLRQPPF